MKIVLRMKEGIKPSKELLEKVALRSKNERKEIEVVLPQFAEPLHLPTFSYSYSQYYKLDNDIEVIGRHEKIVGHYWKVCILKNEYAEVYKVLGKGQNINDVESLSISDEDLQILIERLKDESTTEFNKVVERIKESNALLEKCKSDIAFAKEYFTDLFWSGGYSGWNPVFPFVYDRNARVINKDVEGNCIDELYDSSIMDCIPFFAEEEEYSNEYIIIGD